MASGPADVIAQSMCSAVKFSMNALFHSRTIAWNNAWLYQVSNFDIFQTLKQIVPQFSPRLDVRGGIHILRYRAFLKQNDAQAWVWNVEKLPSLIAIR